MRAGALITLELCAALIGPLGCSGANSGGAGGTGAGGAGQGGSIHIGGSGGNGGIAVDGGSGSGGSSAGCSIESQFVYVLDRDAVLYKFDPPKLAFTSIGTLNCPSPFGTPFSMAVDRNANAWVVYTDGSLFQVDTKTAGCKPTAFQAGQQGFVTFGMGFSTAGPGSIEDTLYVSQSEYDGSTIGLGKIDTQSLMLSPIGMYDQLNARAELTGTGDGRLYGAFEGSPYTVAEIDKATAKIKSQAPQNQIQYAPGSSNFAFAFWGGSFWLFVGGGYSTDVFQYDPAANSTVLRKSETFAIVGAGVSTCAPIEPPA